MGILDEGRRTLGTLLKLPALAENTELRNAVLELQGDLIEANTEMRERDAEIQRLKHLLAFKSRLHMRGGAAWFCAEGYAPMAYCASCWGAQQLAVLLTPNPTSAGTPDYFCGNCKTATYLSPPGGWKARRELTAPPPEAYD